MKDIIQMTREEILELKPEEVDRQLTPEEILYIATTLGAFWSYKYRIMRQKIGMHAILKSGRHSDGFFISRILLDIPNIRRILAAQLAKRMLEVAETEIGGKVPVEEITSQLTIIGIPTGATSLGKEIADILGCRTSTMEKQDGRLVLTGEIDPDKPTIFIEDVFTHGTALTEALKEIYGKYRGAFIVPFVPVILNRGEKTEIVLEGIGPFTLVPLVHKTITDWPDHDCPLCPAGSKPIKPKETDENWRLITTSQL